MKNITENIKLTDIVPDEHQPRKLFDVDKIKNLTNSIKKYGVMTPLTVEKIGEKYLIVDGERRYRASKELGLKEIPAIVVVPKGSADRLVQQFHLQEQHEGWTPTEKASTVFALSKELGLSMEQIGELLALEPNTLKRYFYFANLLEKKEFQRSEISINWAYPINSIKNIVKSIYENTLEKSFTIEVQRKLEKKIILEIKNGEISKPTDLSRLKDALKRSPKSIEEYINNQGTISELFIKTKARSAYHLRNLVNSAGYMGTHIERYLEHPDVIPSENDIRKVKSSIASINKFLAKFQD